MTQPVAGDHTKLTVNLTPKAVESLEHASLVDGLSRTDVINRALQVYALVVNQRAAGWRMQFARRRWLLWERQEVTFL
jgi:hypothetical protein